MVGVFSQGDEVITERAFPPKGVAGAQLPRGEMAPCVLGALCIWGGAVYWVMASDGKGEKWTLCVSGAREFDFDFRAL